MEMTIFIKEFRQVDSIARFMDFYHSLQMNYLASDLLEQGLSPKQITDAVIKAINIGKVSGLMMKEHFKPVFSGFNNKIIIDCKLSHLAYGLVLLNADVELNVVGNFQITVLRSYINSS
ncbi:hypothetical protein Q2T41_14685 [Maribacter confluentis]|uniref:Uncharacterized protein n=1 Tax=Maribacter confluentis TaxID=1656093 RepID=A0ABT8RSJ6_9FLAO|nr:hypothetical protein [Maribacter confluentis]MDO1513905.1 hypothetical protein [Maribacter confluentis]